MWYCSDSQYLIKDRALLLFQMLSEVRSRAFRPKMRSISVQLAKEVRRSTEYSREMDGVVFNFGLL